MKVLLVGSGGREHAIAWKLAQSPRVTDLIIAPGNAGTAELGENVAVQAEDIDGLLDLALSRSVDLTFVGPEQPLVDGISDRFTAAGLKVFGPTAAAARIEGSKIWSDDLMARHGIPTAESRGFTDSASAIEYGRSQPEGSLVVKADGLAAGKGVLLPETYRELDDAITGMIDDAAFGDSSASILLAERMMGPEVSVFAFLQGEVVSAAVAACDYKRIGEGDTGLNTGGVGSYTPPEFWTPDLTESVRREILEPTARALVAENSSYSGILYAGLMVTETGPRVIEFNCRFGDPETQILMPKLETDLFDISLAVAEGRLAEQDVRWSDTAYTFVVMVSDGYPGSYETGAAITGVAEASEHGLVVHAGTDRDETGVLVTSGGRVLGVAGSGDSVRAARDSAYAGVEKISFEGARYRRDIADRAVQDL
ncbi:MAG: phosphoribosylamine--glycine ligase [Dehalococcoidia bacterium]|nr:phosphoribosylamine--glycine ligase [Dehalococcoidia bacterium]